MVPGGDDTARGLSLWLMPEGAAHARLQALILDLAGKNHAPAFPPHLTLLGGISASEAAARAGAAELARQLGPLTIHLGEIETSEAFFRCIYARADLTETLRAAELRAREPFSETASPFLPHVSLLYGHLSAPAREALRQDLGGALEVSFTASRLHLFRTEGPPRAWRLCAVFPLQGGGEA
jgi:2'-5' RNA ligase